MKNILGLMLILVSTSAMAAEQPETSGAMAQGIMLAAFVAIFYFLILRPQSKRAKDHQKLISDLQKGDEIITNGGLLGRIKEIDNNFFVVAIADGVEIFIQRQAVATSVPKGTMKGLN